MVGTGRNCVWAIGAQTLGHVRLHGLAPVPLTSPRCFPEFPVGKMTPLACRVAPAPAAARPAPRIPLRGMLVAVDATDADAL